MTVQELITLLSAHPLDKTVYFLNGKTGYTSRANHVYILNCNEPDVEFLEGDVFDEHASEVVIVSDMDF